jgi:hypothetical protein
VCARRDGRQAIAVGVLREHTGANAVGCSLSAMGLACALAGILLGAISVEISAFALGALGYGLATRSGDRAGQVLGVAAVVLCAVSVAIPWSDLPGLFLET